MKLETIIGDRPQDERQVGLRDAAAWKSFLGLGLVYLAIGIFFALNAQPVPMSTEILASAAFLIFAYSLVKNEAISFSHPWLPDNEVTRNQPAIIRSAPWMLLVGGFLGIVTSLVDTVFVLNQSSYGAFDLVSPLLGAGIGLLLNLYFARRLRFGGRFTVILFRILGVIAVLGFLGAVAGYLWVINSPNFLAEIQKQDPQVVTFPAWSAGIGIIFSFWPICVVWKYGKRMVEDGKSFNK